MSVTDWYRCRDTKVEKISRSPMIEIVRGIKEMQSSGVMKGQVKMVDWVIRNVYVKVLDPKVVCAWSLVNTMITTVKNEF